MNNYLELSKLYYQKANIEEELKIHVFIKLPYIFHQFYGEKEFQRKQNCFFYQ